MKLYQVRIVNVIAYMKTKHLDLNRMAKHNKEIDYDENIRLGWIKTTLGHGKITIMKGGLNIVGMKSEKEARSELRKALKRLKFYYTKDD